jgi:hypothetical protein
VKENGELVSRLEEHGTADAVGDEKPRVRTSSQLDVPAEGIHRVLVQDGSHVSVHDATAAPTTASEEQTTKVCVSIKTFILKIEIEKNIADITNISRVKGNE